MNGFNNRIEMVEVKSANLETFQWNSPNLKNSESLDFKKKGGGASGTFGKTKKFPILYCQSPRRKKEKGLKKYLKKKCNG